MPSPYLSDNPPPSLLEIQRWAYVGIEWCMLRDPGQKTMLFSSETFGTQSNFSGAAFSERSKQYINVARKSLLPHLANDLFEPLWTCEKHPKTRESQADVIGPNCCQFGDVASFWDEETHRKMNDVDKVANPKNRFARWLEIALDSHPLENACCRAHTDNCKIRHAILLVFGCVVLGMDSWEPLGYTLGAATSPSKFPEAP